MLRLLTLGSSVLPTYPEKNPYDHDPPLFNLIPTPPRTGSDTQELRDACRAIAERTAMNPLNTSYGPCPLFTLDLDLANADLPFTEYTTPPPLPSVTLSEPLIFLQQINPTGNTALFTVRVGDHIRLLKLFRDQAPFMGFYRKPEEAPPHPLSRFETEKTAYAHLLHYGACDRGAVPRCFGWLALSPAAVDAIEQLPGLDSAWRGMRHDPSLPRALLLEYFPGAAPLDIDTITPAVAEKVCRALYAIHACYVLHNDINRRNVLLLPDGRVVWVDFDAAWPAGGAAAPRPLRRQYLAEEFVRGWSLCYVDMLPDKRIGFRSWLY